MATQNGFWGKVVKFFSGLRCHPKGGANGATNGARYVIMRSEEQFRFVLKAGNNEIILASERYTTKQSVHVGIASVRKNSPHDERYDRIFALDGSPMFNLKATNGEVIGTSQLYSSPEAREVGIRSVKANGPSAPIDDET